MPQENAKDTLVVATGAHGMFKARLFEAIERGDLSEFASAKAGRDDLCVFGKWLHEEIPVSLKLSAHFPRVQALHADFHKSVARALVLAERGKKAEAIDSVRQASTPLTIELMAWSRELDPKSG
jgi:hypothetical protein